MIISLWYQWRLSEFKLCKWTVPRGTLIARHSKDFPVYFSPSNLPENFLWWCRPSRRSQSDQNEKMEKEKKKRKRNRADSFDPHHPSPSPPHLPPQNWICTAVRNRLDHVLDPCRNYIATSARFVFIFAFYCPVSCSSFVDRVFPALNKSIKQCSITERSHFVQTFSNPSASYSHQTRPIYSLVSWFKQGLGRRVQRWAINGTSLPPSLLPWIRYCIRPRRGRKFKPRTEPPATFSLLWIYNPLMARREARKTE